MSTNRHHNGLKTAYNALRAIILLLGIFWTPSAYGQLYCTVFDTLKAPDGTAIANSPVYVSRVYLGSQPINLGTYRYMSNASGIVSFSIFRGATAYIQCNYLTFNVSGGVNVTIPNAATTLLRNLAPASSTVSTNAGFVRVREIDGSPAYAVTGNNDTLEVSNSSLSQPSTNVIRITTSGGAGSGDIEGVTAGNGLGGGGASGEVTLNVLATDGVKVSTDSVRLQLGSASGLEIVSGVSALDSLRIDIDGTTLSRSSTGVKVATAGITATEIGADAVGASELDETATFDITGSMTFDSDALQIDDTNASHQLVITPGSDLTADRVLTITTGDAARTLTLSGDATISGTNTGDQTISLSGDISGSGTGAITTTIGADKVLESMLKAVNAATDEDILTYESTTGDFEWQTPAETGLALSATTITVAGTANEITSSAGAQDLSANRTWTLSFPTALTLKNKILQSDTLFYAEGLTANDFETSFSLVDPTADRHISFPNATGEVSVLGQTIGTSEVESGVTLDTEWDTEGEVQTAWGSVNILLETEIDASSELSALMDDETGSGSLVFSAAPALTGAVTFGNGATSAGTFRVLEDTDDGSNYTQFSVPALTDNVVYTLPPNDGTTGQVLHTDGSGVLTWDADDGAGGGAPTDVDYLVGSSSASLSAEIVVGTSPGGELGGTWASPTIDADAVLWNEVGDAGADATIANGAHETDFTSTIDAVGEAVITVTNTDADAANANSILILAHNDGADAEVTYVKMVGDADGTPTNDYVFDQVSFTSLLPVNVPAEAYDATGWNGDTGAPQKDAVRDEMELKLAITTAASTYQPLEATLTDIADGTIAEDLVNTANPWADNEVANNLTVDDAGIASTITRDSEWDTEGEVQTAWGAVNILLETEIDASSELAALMDDETGSGALAFATSPALVTATATGAPGLALSNGATSAGSLRILEDTDDGANYTDITVPAMAANITYTLPPDDGDAGEQLQTNGSGVLTWEAAGSGSGAPTDADYLVGTANGSLSAEIVVGTSPGGELGGTWASPTIDADAVSIDEVGDAATDATIAMGAHELDLTSTIDAANEAVLTITNTDADAANDNSLLDLKHNDGADANVFYMKMIGDADGTPTTDYSFSQSQFTIIKGFDASGASSFLLPQGAALSSSLGELGMDTNAYGASRGAFQTLDGTEEMFIPMHSTADMPSAGDVLHFHNGRWVTHADSTTAGGPTAWDAIADATGNGSVGFGDTEQIIVSSQTSGDVTSLTLDINQVDDGAATDDLIAMSIDAASESGDAGDTFTLLRLLYENGTANTVLDRALLIDNAETTASTMTDAIQITSSGVDGGVVDAIDVSAANITNAINIGENNIITGAATIGSTELDLLDGGVLWNELTAPAAAVSMVSDGTSETVTFDFQSAFTTGTQFLIKQSTGNPSGGGLFGLQTADSGIDPIAKIDAGGNSLSYNMGLQIVVSGSTSDMATAIDVSDADITTALAAGGNNISIDGYRMIEIPAGYFNPAAGDLTGATSLANDADNTNDFTLDQLEFSASAENYASATINMPEDWDASTAPKFKVIYYSETGHASNTVEWDIATGYIRPDTDSWIAAIGTAATANDIPTTADVWYVTAALAPTPAGTAAAGAQLKIRIMRDGDDATNDTHTATARLVKVLMQYKVNQVVEMTSW